MNAHAATKPRQQSAPRTEQLLERIETIYLREGYRGSSMAALAERLRCSKRALYQLADSREGLFLLVLDRTLEDIWQLGLAAEKSVDPLQSRIQAYIETALVPLRRWSPAFLRDIDESPIAHAKLEQHLEERMARLEGMVSEGIASGVFRTVHPKLIAEMLHVSAARFCSPQFLASADVTLETAIKEMCDLMWNGLLHPEHLDPPESRRR